MASFTSINPADLIELGSQIAHDKEDVSCIIEMSDAAFHKWSSTNFVFRKAQMLKAAEVLIRNKDDYARLITQEMGKPFAQSVSEIEKCALVCRYYAENGEAFLANEYIETDASASYIAYNPMGPILAVMPWNFPFWQVFRFAAPTLMAGNTALLKHASNVQGCAMAIEEVFAEAGFPENVFRTLKVKGSDVAGIIANPKVKGVTLTGSVGAGMSVAAEAGKHLKKTVLELGGSDPYIILEDADLDVALDACITSKMINAGQTCISAKRFIVVEALHDVFVERFTALMKQKVMGDPFDAKTDLGPMAQESLRDEVHQQVMECYDKGANIELGGNIPLRKGAWYTPTVLTKVKPGMPAWDDEIFGPVAAIIRAKDETDAIRIANDTVFGLGAAVFTKDVERGRKIAETKLRAGCCFVNDFVKSDPRLPFGGIGHSGFGRELSYLGIREFTNIKTVYVK